MFQSLKALWKKRIIRRRIMIGCPSELAEETKTLENELQGEPGNGEIQKALMLKYNRALSVYAKAKYIVRISTHYLFVLMSYAILFAVISREA